MPSWWSNHPARMFFVSSGGRDWCVPPRHPHANEDDWFFSFAVAFGGAVRMVTGNWTSSGQVYFEENSGLQGGEGAAASKRAESFLGRMALVPAPFDLDSFCE